MSPEDIKLWVAIATGLGGIGFSLFNFIRQPSRDNSKRIEALSHEVQENERRIDRVETKLEHMPTKDDFTEVQLSLSELRGTVSTTEEIVKTVRRTTQNIDDWLRSKGS